MLMLATSLTMQPMRMSALLSNTCRTTVVLPASRGLTSSTIGPKCTYGCKYITGLPEPRKPDNIVTGIRLSMLRAAMAAVHQQRRNESRLLPKYNRTCQTLCKKAVADGAGHAVCQGRAEGGQDGKGGSVESVYCNHGNLTYLLHTSFCLNLA